MIPISQQHHMNRQIIIQSDRVLLDYSTLPHVLSIPFNSDNLRITKLIRQQVASNLSQSRCRRESIKAVYGIIELEINRYLIVVKESLELASIFNKLIYRVQKVQFIPLAQKVAKQDKNHIDGLQSLFDLKQFYYSDSYELTQTADRAFQNNQNDDDGFYFYNKELIKQFFEIDAKQWITKFISGIVEKSSFTLNHDGHTNNCDLLIISRRNRTRQGARWLCRGADNKGNAVNTVATQQILAVTRNNQRQLFSFTQIRGSIPFMWQQKPSLQWTPKCKIIGTESQNLQTLKNHFKQIQKDYKEVTVINLVSKTKSQQRMLGQQYSKLVQQSNNNRIKFIWFDFLSVCKNMKYQNLSQLIDIIKYSIPSYGYTHIIFDKDAPIKKSIQKGVFRVNCMDCLDRTNVVQSVIARNVLHKQLNKLIEYDESENQKTNAFQKLPTQLIQYHFRSSWSKNGDLISLLYAGTPAMKSDFTLMSKRTFGGAIKDGVFAIKRYSLGNFYDYQRQNANDILIKKLSLKVNKIKKPKTNPLFVLFVCMVATPFLISYVVDWIIDSDSVDSLRSDVRDRYTSDFAIFLYKLIGSVVGMFSIFKIFQTQSNRFLNSAAIND